MQRKLVTPSRLAVAAALALGGLIAGPSVAPVKAGDCVRVTAWYYKNQQGREYLMNNQCVVPSPLPIVVTPTVYKETDTPYLPPGTPTGAGIEVTLPLF